MIIFILQLVPISPKLLLFPKAPGKKRDPLVTQEETTAKEREQTFTTMMEIALEIA